LRRRDAPALPNADCGNGHKHKHSEVILKALALPVLVALPLMAQPSGGEVRFWQAVRRSSQPCLLVFEDDSRPMSASVGKLLQEEGIADLGLAPMTLSQKNDAELAAAVRRRLSLAPSVRWAVVAPGSAHGAASAATEQCLASGQALPTVDGLAKALAAKGIQSPIRVLREFLKDNPDHLEARMDMLRLQHKSAERRTRAALALPDAEEQPGDQGLRSLTLMLRKSGDDIFGRPKPKPKPVPTDKALEGEQDLKIWGGYADSFDRLFTGDDWIAGGWGFEDADAPLEGYSPLVKNLYRRKLKQAEAALETAPSNYRLWSVWMRMADAVGGQSIMAVFGRLAQPPGGGFESWPAAVRRRLLDEARDKNMWDYIASYLWGYYEDVMDNPRIHLSIDSNAPNSSYNEEIRRIMDEMQTREWDTLFEPLLEALLRMGDTGRADAVMNTLRERQAHGQWSETQMHKAIALANRCERQDVAKRWSIFLPEKNDTEQGRGK